MGRPLKIGVAGLGFGASVHIPVCQSEGLDVAAVCDLRKDRAEATAKRFGVANVFTDYKAMLQLPGLDAVSIVTPVSLHCEMSLAALEAGKHVICEKPLAVDAFQAQEMTALARQRGLTAMVAYEFRFAPAVAGAKALLDSGYVGDLHMCLVRLVVGGPRKGARVGPPDIEDRGVEGGGLLTGVGSHYVDCLRYWFGEVDSVSGDLDSFTAGAGDTRAAAPAKGDDTFLFTLHFASGGFAHMIGTAAAAHGPGASIEIYGSEGTLIAPPQEVSWRALSPRSRNPPVGGKVLAARVGDRRLQELPVPDGGSSQDRDAHVMPFRRLVREFVRGVEEGCSPSPSFYDGLRCQQILDCIRASAATGRRVAIPPPD